MTKTYTVRERMVAARPRSKRLRMLGGATSTGTSTVSYSSWEGSGGGSTFTLTITRPSEGVVSFNGTNVDFSHGHDWGDIVNKPNLVEGVIIGNNKISFLHSNGDTVVANFSSIATRVSDLEYWRSNPQGATQAIADLQSDVAGLKTGKASKDDVDYLMGMQGGIIEPYVWGSSSSVVSDWEVGLFWFDTSTNRLKMYVGKPNVPFEEVSGAHFLLDTANSCIKLYYDDGSNVTITTLHTI